MSALTTQDLPDARNCGRCGARIRADGDSEYRCRYRLEDAASSAYGASEGKLCFECWDAVQAFLEGDSKR